MHGCTPVIKFGYSKKATKFEKIFHYWCFVLLQVPKYFELVQIFCAIQNFIYILCQTKRWFAFSKIGFCASTKVFEKALNAVKFLGWLKKFGTAQNILGPVKGQGIRRSEAYKNYKVRNVSLLWGGPKNKNSLCKAKIFHQIRVCKAIRSTLPSVQRIDFHQGYRDM